MIYLGLLCSFLICSLGQPVFYKELGLLAAFLGYGLFWRSSRHFQKPERIAFMWFFAVSLVQLSWLSDPSYTTQWIYLAYIAYSALLALGFVIGSSLVYRNYSMLVVAAAFTMIEYCRLYILSGLPFNPAGLHLATSFYPAQMAAWVGILGLSFWVYLANGAFYKAQQSRALGSYFCLVAIPFVAGYAQYKISDHQPKETINVALVETKTAPRMPGSPTQDLYQPITGLDNWRHILEMCRDINKEKVDLLVFPEGAFLTSMQRGYDKKQVDTLFEKVFGNEEVELDLIASGTSPQSVIVNNAYITQKLSDYMGADVIAGFDDHVVSGYHNAAFLFGPEKIAAQKYAKQLLVPLTEYFPFSFVRYFAQYFGIDSPFVPGKSPGVLEGNLRYGILICYEEIFSHMGKNLMPHDPDLLVNISNDVWFPRSNLAQHQQELGRLRAIELGRAFVRVNNLATTCVFDCFGQLVDHIEDQTVLMSRVPITKQSTLFARWGDRPILIICICTLIYFFIKHGLPLALKRED